MLVVKRKRNLVAPPALWKCSTLMLVAAKDTVREGYSILFISIPLLTEYTALFNKLFVRKTH